MIQQPQILLPQPVQTDLFMSQSSLSTTPVGGQPFAVTSFTRQTATNELASRDFTTAHHPIFSAPTRVTTTAPPTTPLNFTAISTHHKTNKAPTTQHTASLSSSIHRSSTHAMKRVSQKDLVWTLNKHYYCT